MASKKVEKRYANSPKVKPKATASDGPVAEPEGAIAATPPAAPAANVTNGTEGIPVQERQVAERSAMTDGHMSEMKDMHKRHAGAIADMTARHLAELGMGDGGTAKKKG